MKRSTSCGSGSGVYSNDTGKRQGGNPRNFTEGVMNAFSGYLDGGVEDNTGELLNQRFSVLAACRHGEESSDIYFVKGTVTYKGQKVETPIARRGGVFTYALVTSLGCSYPGGAYGGKLSADSNGDGKLTLREAYVGTRSRIKKMNTLLKEYKYSYGDNYVVWYEPTQEFALVDLIDQSVQMGGADSTVLFRK